MTLPVCQVVCVMHGQDGAPEVGAVFTARLNSYEVYQGYVVPEITTGTADADGICTLNLWPNELGAVESAYDVTMRSATGKSLRITAVVPNQAAANLHDIAVLPPYPGKIDGQLQLEQAIEAGQVAQVAQQAADASAVNAAASAAAALASEQAAATSATAAAASATSAAGSLTVVAILADNAADSETAAAGSATAAATSANNAATSETNAGASATSATASAATATTKAGEALTSANNAATSATAAASSATDSATSATASAASAASAAASYDAFDDRSLGPKAADPTLDNDGNALLEGALYWNTVSKEMRAYNGTAWVMTSAANALSRTGDTATGPISVPSGATGAQAIGADEAHTRTDEVVLNGGFSVAQEALGSRADDTYGHDGWIVLTQTGAITPSTLTDVEDGTPYMARLTQSQAAAQRMGYLQVIEGQRCRHLRGQQVTFRFNRMRLSASANVRIAVLEWTGTEDAVTSDVVADWTSASYMAGGFFNATTLAVSGVTSQALTAATMADGASLTVTLGSTFNNLMVFAWTEGTVAQNAAFDLGKAQLDIGGAARPFRHHHRDQVLLDCSRFATPIPRAVGTAYATTAAVLILNTPVPMRSAPAQSGGTHTLMNSSGTPTNVTAFTVAEHKGVVVYVDASVASGLSISQSTNFVPAANSMLLARL